MKCSAVRVHCTTSDAPISNGTGGMSTFDKTFKLLLAGLIGESGSLKFKLTTSCGDLLEYDVSKGYGIQHSWLKQDMFPSWLYFLPEPYMYAYKLLMITLHSMS